MSSKYTHNSNDPWTWERATESDVTQILQLCQDSYKHEADTVFDTSWSVMERNLHLAIVNQTYRPDQEIVCVARNNNVIVAYFWSIRHKYMEYSADELSEIRFIHCDQSLSVRVKLRLVAQILEIWEAWATINNILVLSSSTMRSSQSGFLRLHEQFGYSVRGSCCFKRVTPMSNVIASRTSRVLELDPVRD